MDKIPSAKIAKNSKHPNLNVGRKPGAVNKATKTAREAFAMLVDGKAPELSKWLTQVADGIPVIDKDTKQQMERNGIPVWVAPPSPDKALDIVQRIAEYHIPKLARTELVGDEQRPVVHIYKWKDE